MSGNIPDNKPRDFQDDYVEQCFQVWYSRGQPMNIDILHEAIPENGDGKRPGKALLRSWRDSYGWMERADGLNAQAIEKVEHKLIEQKSDMLLRQAEQALLIANKARDHLLENGFDSSSSAVSALFKATEEERTVRGISDFLIKISRMDNDGVMNEAMKLLKRSSEAVDAEVIDSESDGENNE